MSPGRSGWGSLARPTQIGLAAVVVAALVTGILSPLHSLTTAGGSALRLPALPSAGPALEWTDDALGPAGTQAEAVGGLLRLLGVFGWVGFTIGALAILGCFAAQAPGRAAELGVRRAVGASLRRLIAEALFEGAILAGIALGCGVAIGSALLKIAKAGWPGYVDGLDRLGMGPATAISAVLGAACLIPLWLVRSRRLAQDHDTEVGLRIPTLQVAVSIALLMASAALLGQAATSRDSALGYRPGNGVIAQIDSGIEDPVLRWAKYAALLTSASQDEDSVLLSLTSPGATIGLGTVTEITTDCGNCSFGGIGIRWPHFQVVAHSVSPDSFRVLGVRVFEGRGIALADREGSERIAVVNRILARRYFQGGQAVGRVLYLGASGMNQPYRVIGVVDDERTWVLGGSRVPRENLYLSILQHAPRNLEILARSVDEAGSRRTVLQSIAKLGRTATLRGVASESAMIKAQSEAVHWFGSAFRLMAIAVLIMALTGVIVAMGRWAESVAWEIALRRSLGARRARLAGSIALKVAGVACGGGILGVFLYRQVLAVALAESLSELPILSPAMFIAAALPVLVAAALGSIPAFRVLYRSPATLL